MSEKIDALCAELSLSAIAHHYTTYADDLTVRQGCVQKPGSLQLIAIGHRVSGCFPQPVILEVNLVRRLPVQGLMSTPAVVEAEVLPQTFRDELLDQHLFTSLDDVREAVHWWMIEYNE